MRRAPTRANEPTTAADGLTPNHASTTVSFVEIAGSAYRHHVDDAGMFHAINCHLAVFQFDGYRVFCGPALDGSLLEVRVNDRNQVFHAMECRKQFLPEG